MAPNSSFKKSRPGGRSTFNFGIQAQADQPGDVNNYYNSGTQRLNRNNLDAKINWNRTQKHQLWVKYSVMDALVQGDFGLGKAGGGCLCDGGVGEGHTLTQTAGIGHTYTVSPTFLIDGTLGWTRFGQNVKSPDLGHAGQRANPGPSQGHGR
jgi:hypothetical protein